MNKHQTVFTKDKRLSALHSYHILDTSPEREFDAITRLISSICKTPVALISFIDAERQWIKSSVGVDVKQMPRIDAFCNHTILEDDILEITDVLENEHFNTNRFVINDPQIRFYAGAPLISPDGHRLGALCVMDMVGRKLSDGQLNALRTLAGDVITHLELRKAKHDLHTIQTGSRDFFNLFNSMPAIFCVMDREYRIGTISNGVEKILGQSPGELTGRIFWTLFTDDISVPAIELIKNGLVKQEHTFDIETPIITGKGDVKWLRWSLTFKDNKWYGGGRDITPEKKAKSELDILLFAAQKSPTGIVIRDNNRNVVWINEAHEKLLGYSLADVKGKRVSTDAVGEETDMEVFNGAVADFELQKPYQVELKLYRKDGTPVWVLVSNNPLVNPNGVVEYQVGSLVDITARKKAEMELIAAKEEALQLSQAKDMFISVMSHEIRNPLNAVIGMSHVLMDDTTGELRKENLGILQFSAENLMTLINNVLDFTKIESGNIELEKMNVDLRELVQSIANSMQFNAGEKKIHLGYSVDEAVPQLVMGDRTRLCQILLNLVGNAIKFTETGSVNIGLQVAKQTDKQVQIRFAVTDTGIGIANDKINTIFESFKQATADTSRKYGGTGLGLAITKKLVELHKSKIQVESTPGKGSTFSFTIKFDKEYIHLKNNHSNVETGLQLNVLVVDDNQINRLLISKVLGKWGASTEFAEDGQQAVDKIAANHDLDVVLMDIHMPVMGGLEATQIIRSKPEEFYQKLPIIALTASVMNSDISEINNAGMNDYILKPFDPKGLYDKLSKFQKVRG
ncbi:MAG TPA: ATP-binding protein [Mucilaginibacter sp.]|nr:ATP-binding protein [Mucilaginibacter sp.]